MDFITTLIASFPQNKKPLPQGDDFLEISEFFYNTIQGEGINLGQPAAFLRVQHCTQNCWWCDTREVWRTGNPYTFEELFALIDTTDLVHKLKQGQHLILTGGSPLKQQKRLTAFLQAFCHRYGFKPFIEVENECTLLPTEAFSQLVDVWNNSPKLSHSGNPEKLRYQPRILKHMSQLPNAWFKFVVSKEEDWQEIEQWFLKPDLIKRNQIILMPLAASREELHTIREKVVGISVRETVRYCSREHIELWDKKTGV
ncbi:MAG: 4Fe-4S cluster-binding domain-containing protein [Bacteroidales bacterium]